MTNDQANTLHAIAKALHVIADGSSQGADMVQHGSVLGTDRRTDSPEKIRESEIQREIGRQRRANDRLQESMDALWAKLSPVTAPPTPSEPGNCSMAVEGCSSNVGGSIQNEAFRTENTVNSIRYLIDSLAV